MVDSLLERGITPYITLFHWDLPYELYLKGGWLNPDMPEWFAEYTLAVMNRLSDRVDHWITQNEPQCYKAAEWHRAFMHRTENEQKGIVCRQRIILFLPMAAVYRQSERRPGKTPVIGYAPAAWWLWSPVSDDPADIEACRKQTFWCR